MKSKLGVPHILVVEDEPLTALSLTETVESMGAIVVGPEWSLSRAAAVAQREHIDGAVLDISIGGDMSFGLASELLARHVPVVFVTAWSEADVPPELRDVPRVSKPFGMHQLNRVCSLSFGL